MREKILFVDDEPQVLEGIRRLLCPAFHIDTAVSGSEALSKLKRDGPYAVVVCDMRMPEMDGARLLSKIRIEFPEAVRIMLTGNSDQNTAIRAVNEGHIFQFLTKPCDEDLLTRTLNAALVQYRLAAYKEEVLDRARAGHELAPGATNYSEFQTALEHVWELLSPDAVTSPPPEAGVYFGKVIWEGTDLLVQRLTPVRAVAHLKTRLNKIPSVGELVRIEYTSGAGKVKDFGT